MPYFFYQSNLLERLKADGRFKDWVLAVEDKKIREQFYKEYGIE